jgi:iron(III) transport system substrate-binding protein
MNREWIWFWTAVWCCAGAVGCGRSGQREVVVYCALDREFSEPILRDFEKESGVRVRAKYDVESTKSVALAEQLLRERTHPRADVFWNNEPIHAVRLARAGVLTEHHPPNADKIPESCRDAKGRWHGLAARARVLLVNTDLVSSDATPQNWRDLTHERWRGKLAMAKPLFGTTATQAAWLFADLGPRDAKELLLRLQRNEVQILSGNKQVAVAVGSGRLPLGLTDTDDAWAELAARRPVKMIYLEGSAPHLGVLRLPNAVAVTAGAPHDAEARLLVDYLLSPAVEAALAAGPSKQIPVAAPSPPPAELQLPSTIRWSDVDFDRVADQWDEAMRFLRDEFTAP